MNFAWPYALIALPLALAGVLVLFKTSRRARERLLGHFAAPRLLPLLLASHSPALRRLKQGILLAGVLLTVLALARPQWGYDWEQRQSRGVDVIFVLDTSKSMLSQDVQPSRLERAKLAILDSVEKMGGNRIGLVGFAGDAFLLCPLTLDYDAFRQTLEAVDVNTIARGGTDIASGLDEAAAALEKSGNHKIIVLLTDGEDLEGEGVNEAKALAAQDVTIYTVGVGTPQGEIIPIRDTNGGTDFVRDQRGQIVKSHLDADTLTSIAGATHGFYQPLGATGEGLTKVYEEGIKKIPEQNLSAQMQRQPIERYQWPLGIGTLLLALEMLIGTRRPSWRRGNLATVNLAEPLPVSSARRSPGEKVPERKTPMVAALLLISLFLGVGGQSRAADSPAATPPAQPAPPADATPPADTSAPAQPTPAAGPSAPASTGSAANPAPAQQYSAKDAQSLFQKGDYLGAAEAYGQAADASPQDGRFRYNQGESLYRRGNFDAAADAFSKTLSSNDLQLQQRSYYNLGNTHFRLGQADLQQDKKKAQASWEQAVKDYQNALELNSSDADARYNLGVVNQQLEELKKQMEKQKQQQQNQQDKNDQQQDQQQNQQQNQSQQNQSNQQNNSQQNQSQNGQNQSGQQNQQNSSGSPNQSQNGQNQPQNQSGQQNSPGSQNQPQGQNGPQKQPGQSTSPGNQDKGANQQNQPGQKPGDQKQNGPQPQASAQAGTNPSGKEPGQQNAGQQKAAAAGGTSGAAAGSASTSGDAAANGTVVAGAMTKEEAHQLLDSLKSNEHKLPVSNLQNSNAKPPTDQYQKDW